MKEESSTPRVERFPKEAISFIIIPPHYLTLAMRRSPLFHYEPHSAPFFHYDITPYDAPFLVYAR